MPKEILHSPLDHLLKTGQPDESMPVCRSPPFSRTRIGHASRKRWRSCRPRRIGWPNVRETNTGDGQMNRNYRDIREWVPRVGMPPSSPTGRGGDGHGVWVMARSKAGHRLADFLDWRADQAAAAQSINLGYTPRFNAD